MPEQTPDQITDLIGSRHRRKANKYIQKKLLGKPLTMEMVDFICSITTQHGIPNIAVSWTPWIFSNQRTNR